MLRIKGGRVIGSGYDGIRDILIKDGRILPPGSPEHNIADIETIDAASLIVAPGLVDMHVHFRDPGFTDKEDIITGAAAAAVGGVTSCACMANTQPVCDSAEVLDYIIGKSHNALCRVLPVAAVTRGQRGAELTDFAELKAHGAVALSDDGMPLMSSELMRRALFTARDAGLVIISHCEDAEMVKNHAVNEGRVSRVLGIPGRPGIAEELMVARDAMLARETGARVHIAHVSTAGSVEIIRRAKSAGAPVTAETCPQYFTLTEDEVLRSGTLARVNPPLRTECDRDAIIRGLIDGTIDVIATDHAPHTGADKAKPLTDALSGMIGLETSLALALTALYHTGTLALTDIIRLMSERPAGILEIGTGCITPGSNADLMIFDPDESWEVRPELFKSKARNTPFAGTMLRGRVKYTILGGKIVYKGEHTCR